MDYTGIFNIKTEHDFETKALRIFQYQYENNSVYQQFCNLIHIKPNTVKSVEKIPFLPIQFFKTYNVVSSSKPVQQVFTSSGTTGSMTSKHPVTDLSLYQKSYLKAFQHFYGTVEEYVILALLPSYLEREGSSLIYMVEDLIEKSGKKESGFYLNDLKKLNEQLQQLEQSGRKTLLIGVTFALLDLAERVPAATKKHHHYGNRRHEGTP
jgi:phenylacetate-coenzyme A ligase PaaK-like adenylate-forming protein